MGNPIIPAIYYDSIYIVIVSLFTVVALNGFNVNLRKKNDWSFAVFACVVFVLFLGTRPIDALFADMPLYYGIYNSWKGVFYFDFDAQNLLFDNLECYLASIRFDPTLHYVLFAAIYFGCILVASRKMFPRHIALAFLCYCAAFSTFSYCVNGYKAGSAAAFFLVALAYRDNLKISILFVLLSWGFHHSMQLPVVAFLITQLYSKPKYYYYLWYVCAIISILHISWFQYFFAGLTDEQGAGYLLSSSSNQGFAEAYKSGFRFDFWIYSAMPILIGWWVINKYKIVDKFYNRLLCMYITVNSVWLLCIYASYTNRIAYLSWFMYPFVLIYPLFNERIGIKRTKYLRIAVTLHLLFTLIMHFIYYG